MGMDRDTFRLPASQKADVQRRVDEGEFVSRSEVYRQAIRDFLQELDEEDVRATVPVVSPGPQEDRRDELGGGAASGGSPNR